MSGEPTKPSSPLAWMRGGGTRTQAYENQLAQQKIAAEQARKLEDERRRKAEDGSEEAKQYRNVIGGNKEFPGIVLLYKHPKDNTVLDYITCELSAAEDGSLILILACILCFHKTGEASNITLRQNHRHFELDTKRHGELWVNPNNPSDIVTLAGTISMTEKATCPGCARRFVIDDSVLRYV